MHSWLSKIRSLHTYVIHRMVYFERYCIYPFERAMSRIRMRERDKISSWSIDFSQGFNLESRPLKCIHKSLYSCAWKSLLTFFARGKNRKNQKGNGNEKWIVCFWKLVREFNSNCWLILEMFVIEDKLLVISLANDHHAFSLTWTMDIFLTRVMIFCLPKPFFRTSIRKASR